VSHGACGSPSKTSKKTGKKSGSSASSAGASAKSEEDAHSSSSSSKLGSAAWVAKELEAVGLAGLASGLGAAFPLELLVHVADPVQLDVILTSASKHGAPFPDLIDYIKLQCAIRSMHVKLTGTTGNSLPSSTATPANAAFSSSVQALHRLEHAAPTQMEKDRLMKLLTQCDILTWSVEDAKFWLNCVPSLSRFADSFSSLGIDGHKLLRLSERTLLQHLKMESEADRALVLKHVSDLKALQLTHAATTHSEILSKLIEGLSSELLHKSTANSNKGMALETGFDGSGAETSSSYPSTPASVSSNPDLSSMGLTSKRVPNYFLSLRIASPDLREKVKHIQSEIEALVPELVGSRSMLPPEQLHFTLGRLYLQTETEIALAKSLLEKCHEAVYQRFYPEGAEVAVTFKGVTNYGGNTVFLETERGNERDLLIEFGNTVYDMFQDAGLTSKEFRFQPVAPIIRVRQSKKPLVVRLQEASEQLLQSYSHAQLGRNVFASLDISAVADQTDADGYYKNLHTVLLH